MNTLIQQLKENTENNLHTENYVLLAEEFQLKRLIRIFKCIFEIQEIEGFMPHDINEYRYKKYEELLSEIRIKVSNNEYLDIYNSL